MTRLLLICMGILLLTSLGCSTPRARALARVGTLAIDGDVKIQSAGGGAQVTLDAARLGLDSDDDELVLEPRIDLDLGPFYAVIEILDVEYTGNGIADASATLGPGIGITVGEPVSSELDAVLSRAILMVDVIPTDLLDVGLGIGLGYIDYTIDSRSRAGGGSIRAEDDYLFPFASGRVAAEIWRFNPEVIISGGAIEYDGEDVTYLDIDLALGFRLFGLEGPVQGDLLVGWRHVLVEYEFEDSGDLDIDLDFTGPFAGLAISIGF